MLIRGRSASCSVEMLLECLQQDVLVRAALGSPQRAKAHVCAVIDLERQRNGLFFGRITSRPLSACGLRLRPPAWGLLLHCFDPQPLYTYLRNCVSPDSAVRLALACYTHLRIYVLQWDSLEEPSR